VRRPVLLVDIGNTSVTLGLGRGTRVAQVARVPTADAPGAFRSAVDGMTAGRSLAGAALCSVVPDLEHACINAVRNAVGTAPMVISHRTPLGIGIDYPHPETIGADRLVNAAAAAARFGAPVIVADFGTALTFDVVSREGNYIGGVIAPGLPMMTDYLAERTALLPRIDLKGGRGAVGRSTQAAMRIGARYGYRGMVRDITAHVRRQSGMRKAALCATGGYARWVLKDLDLPFRIEPNLTLRGLLHIFLLQYSRGVR